MTGREAEAVASRMKFTAPLRTSKNWNGIVSILDANGALVSEIYPGQQFSQEAKTRVVPTPDDALKVAEQLCDAYNLFHPCPASDKT